MHILFSARQKYPLNFLYKCEKGSFFAIVPPNCGIIDFDKTYFKIVFIWFFGVIRRQSM